MLVNVKKNTISFGFFVILLTFNLFISCKSTSSYQTTKIEGKKIGVTNEKGEAILCGSTTVRVNCINIAPGPETPTWDISVESPAPLLGGAVVPGRLYLLLSDGLYALVSQETQP